MTLVGIDLMFDLIVALLFVVESAVRETDANSDDHY